MKHRRFHKMYLPVYMIPLGTRINTFSELHVIKGRYVVTCMGNARPIRATERVWVNLEDFNHTDEHFFLIP